MPTVSQILDPVLNAFTTPDGWLAFMIGVLGKRAVRAAVATVQEARDALSSDSNSGQ